MFRIVTVLAGRHFIFIMLFCFTVLAAYFQISDVDVGYHVRTGQTVWQDGYIPDRNTYSSTQPDHPWLLHQWLPATFIYVLNEIGGTTAIQAGSIVFALAIACFILLSSLRMGSSAPWAVLFTLMAVMASRGRFHMRPDLVSAFLFAVLFWHMAGILAGRSRPSAWFLMLVLILWANTHAGFVYGVIFIAGVLIAHSADLWIDRCCMSRLTWRRLAIYSGAGMAIGVLIIALVNPSGPRVLLLPFTFYLDKYYMETVAEYSRPTAGSHPWFFLLLVLTLMIFMVQLAQRWFDRGAKRKDVKFPGWQELIVIMMFAYLACGAQRSIIFFSILAAPCAAAGATALSQWSRVQPGTANPSPGVAAVINILLALLMVQLVAGRIVVDRIYKFGAGMYAPFYPMKLLERLHSLPASGELFHDMRFGGPLLWFVPERKVFIDGRLEAYDKNIWQDVYDPICCADPGWEEMLRHHSVSAALVVYGPGIGAHANIAHVLSEHQDWALIGWQEQALLFLKRLPEHMRAIDMLEIKYVKPLSKSVDYITRDNAGLIIDELDRLKDRGEWFVTPMVLKARCLLVLDRYDEASELYKKVLGVERVPLAVRDLAFLMVRMGRYSEAVPLLDDLPQDGVNCALRADVAENGKDWDKAIKWRQKSVRMEPDKAVRHSELAFTATRIGNYELAFNAFQCASRLDPERVEYSINMATALSDAGHTEEARDVIRGLLLKYPSNTCLIDLRRRVGGD